MSREFQEHLFESFTREETSTVSGIQGTGLGMAISVSHMVQEIAMELLSNAVFSVSLADDGDVANIPIIAMTANAFEEDKQKAFAAGMNAHIAKPIEVDSLFPPSPKCLADSSFLSAGTVNFLLLEKEEKKFTVPADFFLHSFGEVC